MFARQQLFRSVLAVAFAATAGLPAFLVLAGCGHSSSALPTPSSVLAAGLAAPFGGVTLYVDGVHGNNSNDCKSPQQACKTIQHVVYVSASGDTIVVAAAVYSENVKVQHDVHIVGAGPEKTIVNGQQHGSEFFIAFNSTADVSISGMTMRNGSGSGDGGGIYHCFGSLTLEDVVIEHNSVKGSPGIYGYGGAMYNCPGSTLTIIDSTLRNNDAEAGGAICNGGTLTIINSTFNGNTARELRGGGAIFNYGVLHVANSTFSGNTAAGGVGGAIHNGELLHGTGGAIIDNSTISDNIAVAGRSPGGGIYNKLGLPLFMQNTIVADNAPHNCGGAPIATEGFNLSSDKSCDFDGAGDQNDINPILGPLQNNGGPTWTRALLGGSPAIDAGSPAGCRDWNGHLLRTDQRAMPRPDKGDSRGCDIGAYERQNVL